MAGNSGKTTPIPISSRIPSRITWRDRLRDRFDNTLSRGTVAIIGWLALISVTIVLLAATAAMALGVRNDPDSGMNFIEGVWYSLMRTLDPGTMARTRSSRSARTTTPSCHRRPHHPHRIPRASSKA